MDVLILRALDGIATGAELEQLRRWRAEAPENERHYEEVSQLWSAIPGRAITTRPSVPPDPKMLMQRAATRPARVPPTADERRRAGRPWIAVAAAALIAIGVAGALRWSRWRGRTLPAPKVTEFVTGSVEMSTVQLPDGSVVRLAPKTRLRLSGAGDEREVSLEGRAYFAIAKMERRPFRIRTAAGDITVLGTRFDLQAEHRDLRLIVIDGQVALSTSNTETAVGRGEMTRVLDGTPMPVVKLADVGPLVSWIGNFLAFRSTPLREVAVEIGARFGIRVVLADSALRDRTVTAWFTDQSLDDVLRVVCAASLAVCTTRGGTVTMRADALK